MNISTNKGGLSNRMKSLVSCIKLAEESNNKYAVKWDIVNDYKKDNHLLNCSFNKLFINDIEIIEIEKNNIIYDNHCLSISDNDNIPHNFNNFDSKLKSRKFTKNDKFNRNIDFMYNDIHINVKIKYIKYFKILKLHPILEENINEFSKNFNEKTISVHIRSWNRNNESKRSRLYDLNKYIDIMNKYPTNNFYLSSDSQNVLNELKEIYKERIYIYPRKTSLDNSRDFPEGIQEDLIELYLLSKNKIIIGSHFSTFTEVAWWLAECPKDIIII